MKILSNTITGNGYTLRGECLMLDRYGTVYPCIDNLMHPNPGTEEDEYSEIERTVDWLYANNIRAVYPLIDKWLRCRIASLYLEDSDLSLEDIISDTMYSDIYEPCQAIKDKINEIHQEYVNNPRQASDDFEIDELSTSRSIAKHLNERFLRVRAGGKLNPEGTNSIYFRISSHGYDWHRVIVDFLWDIFQSPKQMPLYIWIGHDAETNPPEVKLFEGSPDDLLGKFDSKIFADYRAEWDIVAVTNFTEINMDRQCYRKNKKMLQAYKKNGIKYTPYV